MSEELRTALERALAVRGRDMYLAVRQLIASYRSDEIASTPILNNHQLRRLKPASWAARAAHMGSAWPPTEAVQ